MTIYSRVNSHLHSPAHHWRMKKEEARSGAKKGVPKPLERTLDDGFPGRLLKAIDQASPKRGITELANAAGCSRQSIHNYLSGDNKLIEVFVLFDLAKALGVSPEWLLLGTGEMARVKQAAYGRDERMALNIVSLLTTPEAREDWFDEGFRLHRRLTDPPQPRKPNS